MPIIIYENDNHYYFQRRFLMALKYSRQRQVIKDFLMSRKELEEMKKENDFLKKAAAFFAKEIDEQHIDLLTKTKDRWD